VVVAHEATSVHGVMIAAAEATPDRTAVTFTEGSSYTHRELLDEVARVAAGFKASGVREGDRVALVVSNRIEFLTSYFALSMIGAVSVPLNTSLKGEVLTYMLSTVGPCRLVLEDQFYQDVKPSIDASGAVDHTWLISTDSDTPSDIQDFSSLLECGSLEEGIEPHSSDLVSILFTSGTTGRSKGVMWSHRTALGTSDNADWVMAYSNDDVVYTCLPLFHINALFTSLLPGFRAGARLVISPRFSASKFWREVTEHDASVTNMLGAMGALLWKNARDPYEKQHALRLAMVVPFPKKNHEEFSERFGLELTELYGSTDTAVPVGMPYGESRPGSCGTTAPGWEVALVDEFDEPVPPGTPGELVTRPSVPFMGQLGYWKEPEKTWEAHRNCWFHTGDQAIADEDGYFYFLDRSKDAMRVSGENVSSFEVEQILNSHPSIAEVAVVGVPSDLGEDDVIAHVILDEGSLSSPEELEKFAVERLPYFAVPRYFAIVDELPKTSTQKVRKGKLREIGIPENVYDGGQRRRSRRTKAER